jgi:pyridoxamine 5'-phosphate oxidase
LAPAVFQLATTDDIPIPHVRSLIFRKFLVKQNKPSLPLLLTSTDIRTPKVAQLVINPTAELAWWIEATQQQYRITADVYPVPNLEHPLHSNFEHALSRSQDGTGLALFKDEDWESQRLQMFKSMSAHMKASWCRPVPGSPLKGGQDEAKNWPEVVEDPSEHEDLPPEKYDELLRNWNKALTNFALVIIDPIEVDLVEMGVVPNRRTRFYKASENHGLWSEEELVP